MRENGPRKQIAGPIGWEPDARIRICQARAELSNCRKDARKTALCRWISLQAVQALLVELSKIDGQNDTPLPHNAS
jgi:hypothetical protein